MVCISFFFGEVTGQQQCLEGCQALMPEKSRSDGHEFSPTGRMQVTALMLAMGSVSTCVLVMLHEMELSLRRCSATSLCSPFWSCGLKWLGERNEKQQSRVTKVSISQS